MKKLFFTLLVLIILMNGCSHKDSGVLKNEMKGRYVESTIALPEGISKDAVIKLSKKDGMPLLYVFSKEGTKGITGYQMNKDGTWAEATPKWLNSLPVTINPNYQNEIFEDSEGNQYLYYTEITNDSYKGNLLCSKDGSTSEVLHPEGWEDIDPELGTYKAPDKVNVLANGTLVALFYDGVITYNKDTYQAVDNLMDTTYCNTILYTSDNNLILGEGDMAGSLTGIDVFDIANIHEKEHYDYQPDLTSNYYIDMNSNNDIILCCNDGIQILEQSSTLWQKKVDGSLNSLSMPSLWAMGFIAGQDDNYYVLFNSDPEGYSLKKYSYDKTVASSHSTELTVFSLHENSTLREAASTFVMVHPEVKINFNTAMTEDEYEQADNSVKDDYIKALNTELLAGGGSDILVLDDMPVNSFVDKGVLSDISDIINPLVENGELNSNVINNYKTGDKFFSIPARFSLNLLCGRNNDVKNLTSIEKLSEYALQHKDQSLFGNMTLMDFLTAFAPYMTNKIMDEEGQIKREDLIKVLQNLKMIADNCGIVDEYKKNGRGNNMWNLASSITLCLVPTIGLYDSMYPLGFVTYVDGCFVPFENSYTPICELGINKASSHQELCKEFISTVLSKEIGCKDFYDGFSTNNAGLAQCMQSDLSEYASYTEIENEDGSSSPIYFNALNEEQLKLLSDACYSASNRVVNEDHLFTIYLEETKDFFQGNISAEATADNIIERSSIYLSE